MRQLANCGAGFQPAFAAETAAPQCVIPGRAEYKTVRLVEALGKPYVAPSEDSHHATAA